MADSLYINNEESLERWLEGKPAEWAQLLALRAALRVFPLLPRFGSKENSATRTEFQALTLAVWRCLIVSSVARKYSNDEIDASASAAVRAATDARKVASYKTEPVVRAATAAAAALRTIAGTAAAVRAVTYAQRASASEANAANDVWAATAIDCEMLSLGKKLDKAGLWMVPPAPSRSDTEYVPGTPVWIEKRVSSFFEDQYSLLGRGAALIAGWYQPLLTGGEDAAWSRMFFSDRAQGLAVRSGAFWEVTEKRPADIIMSEIADVLGWEPQPVSVDDTTESKDGSFIFLSHARTDRLQASAVRQMLLDQGIQVWWDDDIVGGDGWRDRIAERLEKSAAVLTLWSDQSVSRDAVREEAARAQTQRKLVHAKLDQADLPYGFGETHYIDLRSWDGTATHESWRKLVQALQDKLSPPGPEEIRRRLSESRPVAMVAESGKLSPRDTPPNARPVVTNAPDLEQRLAGIHLSYGAIRPRIDSGKYQVPPDLIHSLDFVAIAISSEPLTWYAIEDSSHSLRSCMAEHDAANTWNATLCKDLQRLAKRLSDLQPLLQPEQVPVGEPGAKPPEPEPVVRQNDVGGVEKMAEQLRQILVSQEAQAVLSESAVSFAEAGAVQIADAQTVTDPDKQLPVVRHGLKRMTYIVGGILSAIGGGVIINLLTAPEAAVTLATRLKPLYDLMVGFF